MTPLTACLIIALAASLFAWVASIVTSDSSWVDRSWSILPVIYVAIFAAYAGFSNPRLNLMVLLILAWGLRLTFNFARKGGYSGVEDYRWPIVRAGMKPWVYQVFNIVFIVLIQNALLLLIALPALQAYDHQDTPLGAAGLLVAVLLALAIVGESVADQQQWHFQQGKRRALAAGRQPEERFVQSGLWRYSRHPNYFFELAIWWLLYLMGALAAGGVLNWTIVGPIALSALFIGSTRLTEQITLSKYPEYADYQRAVSSVIPWFSRSRRMPVEG